jgi:regulator of CtrA degradation
MNPMTTRAVHAPLTPKLVEGLYIEAMTLAHEARAYFDREGADERAGLDPVARVAFSCESLKVTTRLMHIVSWLLVRKAVQAGELSEEEAMAPERRLGRAADAPVEEDAARLARMPARARALIDNSRELFDRVRRFDAQLDVAVRAPDPDAGARALLDRLQASI